MTIINQHIYLSLLTFHLQLLQPFHSTPLSMFRGNFPSTSKTTSCKKREQTPTAIVKSTKTPTRHLNFPTDRKVEKQQFFRLKRQQEKEFAQSRHEIRDDKENHQFFNPEFDDTFDQLIDVGGDYYSICQSVDIDFETDETLFSREEIKDAIATENLFFKRKYNSRDPIIVSRKNIRRKYLEFKRKQNRE